VSTGVATLGAAVACAALAASLAVALPGRRPMTTAAVGPNGQARERPIRGLRLPRASFRIAACALGALAVAAGRPGVGLAAIVVALTLRRLTRREVRARATRAADRKAVLALRALRADLDSGRDPTAALAECRPAFDRVPPLSAALTAVSAVSSQTGAPLAQLVGRLAAVESSRAGAAHELDAALAGPVSSGRLLAALPAAGCLLGSLSGAGSIRFLLGTGTGGACLVLGVVLDAAGLLWLDRLAAGAGRHEALPERVTS